MAFNGIKTNQQDYMNLLYSDSDSDHVPDLKLPPVKGKKQRSRKKSSSPSKDEGGSCGALCVFKSMLVLLICATLVILAGLCIWTLRRVSDLQEQVREMQSSDSSHRDLSLLQERVKDIDQKLTDLKKSDGILEHLKSTVDDLGVRLKKVEATADKLNQSVSTAQSLLNTPKQLEALTKVVSSLGNAQKSLTATTEDLEKRISDMEGKQQSDMEDPKDKKNYLDTQLGDMLSQQIASVNETSSASIFSVKARLSSLEGRLVLLEDVTRSKEAPLDHDAVENLVLALIEEKLKNQTSSPISVPSEGSTNENSEEMAQLSKQMANITDRLSDKANFAEDMGLVALEDFTLLKGVTLMNFENISKTVMALNAEMDSVMQRLDATDSALVKITAFVTNTSGEPVETEPGDGLPADADGTAVSTPAALDFSMPAPSTPQGPENAENLSRGLQIEGINTQEDLHDAFESKWPLENGQLSVETLLSLLKANSTESATTLEQFDTNTDGRFSEEELNKALDLQPPRRRCKCLSALSRCLFSQSCQD